MAISTLSLPVDIPWRRLCVSEDMIDRKVCDREFPYRWRSSVAVFSYEPPEDYQEHEGMTVSYLKVVCTITGFQPDPEEVGIKDRRVDSYWNSPVVIGNYKDIVSKYYGCYGAILEVAIAPSGSNEEVEAIPLSQYPYFTDFEPKKREVYEIVSETGEMTSRSFENVNVRKGTTTTNNHEVLDIFAGFNQGSTYAGTGGSTAIQGQWGTRDMSEQEHENVRTIDQARELRETFSHTTQLTQMYHQLSSYHLGTNRAVFFVVPRPHIAQHENTFVNGPRQLEGIQEFFLVVMRPEDMEEFCVEAYLETAHIDSEPIHEYETSTGTLSLHIEAPCMDTDVIGDDSNITTVEDSETYLPPDGWEIDLDRNGGFRIESVSGTRIDEATITERDRDHITIRGRVNSWFQDRRWPNANICHTGRLDMEVTVYIRRREPNVIGHNQVLWLTGRGVCCGCPEARPELEQLPESVLWEWPLNNTSKVLVGGESRMNIQEANQLNAQIGQLMIRSVNHPDRYPFGVVKFTDTEFVGHRVATLVRTDAHPDNHPVTDIRGLDPTILDKVVQVAPKVSRGRLLEMSLAEQMDRFGLNFDEARSLRRAALGLEGPLPEPQRRWDRPGSSLGTEQTIPNIVGLSLDEARKALLEAHLSKGDVAYQDSEAPRDSVLNQYPNAGEKVVAGSNVDLVLATGAIVRIPNVVGKSLTQTLIMLREAGLESEPEILFASSEEHPKNHILEVTPEWQTYITPHASVVLQVSSGEN